MFYYCNLKFDNVLQDEHLSQVLDAYYYFLNELILVIQQKIF